MIPSMQTVPSFRVKSLKKVGIDPFYQHSIGDFDYGLQISKLGYKIHIYPKFVGECNDNTLQKTWQDETLPRMERIRLKESRKGTSIPRLVSFSA